MTALSRGLPVSEVI